MAAETGFWLETPEVLRLFPTFVWKCQLRPEVHRRVNATILTRVHEMRHGLQALGRGEAWQSGHGLHRLEDFGALVSCIDAAVAAVLAHLRVGGHNAAFWRLVGRYPRAERARGYLIAKSGDAEADDDL